MNAFIYKACESDLPKIKAIADQVWEKHYSSIISQEQIDFMYALMYSADALLEQMQHGHTFFIYEEEEVPLGFVSMKIENDCIKIPKLYVNMQAHGKGIGKKLIATIEEQAIHSGIDTIELNVNRFNTNSIEFYKKVGFTIKKSVDIPLDRFVLEDYVMTLLV